MIFLAISIFLLVSFTFSGIEAGILSVNRVRLRHRLKIGDKAAIKLERLLSKRERILVTVLLVTNLMNIFAIVLSTLKMVHWLGVAGYFVSAIVWLPVYLLGLELFPKSLFRRFPYSFLAVFAELLRLTDLILSPLLWIGARIHRLLDGTGKGGDGKQAFKREDFKFLTIESAQAGTLTKAGMEMINSVVDFHSVTAKDVMVPMAAVQTIRSNAPTHELLALSLSKNLDRLPVTNAANEITGLADVFEVLLDRKTSAEVGVRQRRILTVSPDDQAYNVIVKLRAAHSGFALVMKPGGKPLGILTSEDLFSRLVKAAPQGTASAAQVKM